MTKPTKLSKPTKAAKAGETITLSLVGDTSSGATSIDDAPTSRALDDAPAVALVPTISRKELIERVTADGTIKKKDAREVADATLRVLAEALKAGEELNLPHIGKVRVNRSKDSEKATILVVRMRIPKVDTVVSVAEPLADDSE